MNDPARRPSDASRRRRCLRSVRVAPSSSRQRSRHESPAAGHQPRRSWWHCAAASTSTKSSASASAAAVCAARVDQTPSGPVRSAGKVRPRGARRSRRRDSRGRRTTAAAATTRPAPARRHDAPPRAPSRPGAWIAGCTATRAVLATRRSGRPWSRPCTASARSAARAPGRLSASRYRPPPPPGRRPASSALVRRRTSAGHPAPRAPAPC